MTRPQNGKPNAQRVAELDAHVNTALAPRAAQGGRAAASAIRRATNLACLVRDEGPDTIGGYLDALNPDELYALVTALAAMVPVDQPVTELLGWLEPVGRRLEADAQAARMAAKTTTVEAAA